MKVYTKNPSLCITKWCRNERPPQSRICYKCRKRRFRKKHPLRNCYYNLRTNAKRRGKIFSLTLGEFRSFAIETSYIDKRGITARKFHIDRIDNLKGYSFDNIQSITSSANAKKRNHEDFISKEIDCPF